MAITYDKSITTLAGDTSAPLYEQYHKQHEPQRVYIHLSASGCVSVYISPEITYATLISVHYGYDTEWMVPPDVRGSALYDLLTSDKCRALLDRVHAGRVVRLDGGDYIGRLTIDAAAAVDELEALIKQDLDDLVPIMDADEWLGSTPLEQVCDTTKDIDAIVSDLVAEAKAGDIQLSGNIHAAVKCRMRRSCNDDNDNDDTRKKDATAC